MHQKRNVVENIISICFKFTSFSKDNVNARKDLAALCNHHSLEPKTNAKGNLKRPQPPYCLKPVERKEILMWLKKLKFSDCYASNIKRADNVSTGKLNGLNSHDYHIIIKRLIPIMFRGYFDADLWKIFAELSYFYRLGTTRASSRWPECGRRGRRLEWPNKRLLRNRRSERPSRRHPRSRRLRMRLMTSHRSPTG
jgi:hypothetical protein